MPSGWMPDARHDKRTSWMFAGRPAPTVGRRTRARRAERLRRGNVGAFHHGPRHAQSTKV